MSAHGQDAEQIAALPVRWDKNGKLRVLIVPSRDTARWVMPKGWLMEGKKPWRAAEIEALEEAGALGSISHQPIGTYQYEKRLAKGHSVTCRVTIYPMLVDKLNDRWKERDERKRHWFSLAKAANLVDEKGLARILNKLADQPEDMEIMQKLRKAS